MAKQHPKMARRLPNVAKHHQSLARQRLILARPLRKPSKTDLKKEKKHEMPPQSRAASCFSPFNAMFGRNRLEFCWIGLWLVAK